MIDIVIPHYGSDQLLEACIRSIEKHTVAPYKLCVVDNNSDNVGFAAAVNRGASRGGGEYIAILNNDTTVSSNWADRLIWILQSYPNIGVVGPLSTAESQWQGVSNVSRWLTRDLPRPEIVTSDVVLFPSRLAFFCVVIPRRVWEAVGGLDEEFFMYGEDDDWCLRAQERGFLWCLDLGTIVGHRHRTHYNQETKVHHEASRRRFVKKWGDGLLRTRNASRSRSDGA